MPVEEFLKSFILSVLLQICLKIISVFLFLFGEGPTVHGVGIVPSKAGAFLHPGLSSLMVDWINILPGLEFYNLPEISVQFLNDCFRLDQVLIGDLGNGLPVWAVLNLMILVVFHRHHVDLGLQFALCLALQPIGGVGENPIVVITGDERVHRVLGGLEQRVLEMGVCLS